MEGEEKTGRMFRLGGRDYLVTITCGRAVKINEAIGLDIETEEGVAGMYDLRGSQIVTVAWVCCADAAETLGVTREEFVNEADGEAIADAWSAIMRAIVNFTPPTHRERIETVIETQERLHAAMLGEVKRRLPELDFSAKVREKMEEALSEFPTSS